MSKNLFLLALLGVGAFALPEKFFDSRKEGYYFYEKDIDVNSTKAKKPKIPKNLESLSSKEFEQLLENVKGYAVMHPSKENISDYMRLQHFAVEKSTQFEQAWKEVVIENPGLNYAVQNPTSTYSKIIIDEEENDKLKSYLKSLSRNVGLAVFVKDEEQRTYKTKQILDSIKEEYGLDYTAISINKHPEFAISKGVRSSPDFFVVVRDGEWYRVGTGLIVKTDLVRNIAHIAKGKGLQ